MFNTLVWMGYKFESIEWNLFILVEPSPLHHTFLLGPARFTALHISALHTALVHRVLLWYRTSVLTSTDICQNKASADQYHVTISRAQVYSLLRSHVIWSWPLTKSWLSDWIAGSCQVNLLNTGQDCFVADYGLKVNRITSFLRYKCFVLLYFVYMVIFKPQKVTKLKSKFHFFLG